jgi:hypothetical protein
MTSKRCHDHRNKNIKVQKWGDWVVTQLDGSIYTGTWEDHQMFRHERLAKWVDILSQNDTI